MNQITSSQRAEPLPSPIALPVPRVSMSVRVATRDDMPFMDQLQKLHSKALGFFPRAQMEGYVDGGNVLVALDAATGEKLGYVASKDRYLKRDELGAVFQLCVSPGRERSFIGANLLREVFERSSYGCKLYCCWCAQDLPANRFWEAMGFVPIAYRAGSATRGAKGSPRVHIYWQKRIRAGDTSTPYWFPSKTEGGAIREDRIILPIPPSLRWTDELPVLLNDASSDADASAKRLVRSKRTGTKPVTAPSTDVRFGPPGSVFDSTPATQVNQGTRELAAPERIKPKCDPVLIARARELRDRWMDHVAANPAAMESGGKYAVDRLIDAGTAMKTLAA